MTRRSRSSANEKLDANLPMTWLRDRLWRVYLTAGLTITAVYLLLPRGGLAQALLLTGFHASLVGALIAGLRLHRPGRPAAWRTLIAGHTVYVAAWAIWYVYPVATGVVLPYPSVGDALFLVAYGILAAALAIVVRTRGERAVDLLDASILALGLGALAWVFLLAPIVAVSGLSPAAKATSAAYPLADLVILSAALRLAFSPGARTPAFGLVLAWISAQLVADSVFAKTALDGTFALGDPVFAGWLLSVAALGAAALHPSMQSLTTPGEPGAASGAGRRLTLLTGASLMAPAALLIEALTGDAPRRHTVAVSAAVSAVMFLLVLLRTRGLMIGIAEYERVQHQLAGLASIVASSTDAIVGWDLDGAITSWNQGATNLYGYTPEEALGRRYLMLIPASAAKHASDVNERLWAGERIAPFDTEQMDKDGRVVAVSLTVSAVHDERGRIIGGASIARDISDRRRADAALRASEERTRSIITTAPTPFVAMAADGTITDWNHSAEAAFGWTREEILGRPVETLIPSRFQAAYRQGLERLVSSEGATVLAGEVEFAALHRATAERCRWRRPSGASRRETGLSSVLSSKTSPSADRPRTLWPAPGTRPSRRPGSNPSSSPP